MARGRLLAFTLGACILGGAAGASEQGVGDPAHTGASLTAASAMPAERAEPSRLPPGSIPPPPPTVPLAMELVVPPGFGMEFERRLSTAGRLSSAERADREALKAFYEARHNEPAWVDETGYTLAAEAIRREIAGADQWGLDASHFRVPDLSSGTKLAREARADAEIAISLAVLQYARHARGGRTNPVQLSPNFDRKPPLLDPASVIAAASETSSPGAYLRSLHPKHPQFERLRRQYLVLKRDGVQEHEEVVVTRKGKKQIVKRTGPTPEKLLVNMEQWRWMPEDLGRFHVWVNIPEFTVRVMEDGREIHSERVVVGRKTTQTPIFSDEMKYIVFHPFWGVPESIKNDELLPSLQRGDLSVLSRQGLRISYRSRDINPATVDWSRADMRKYHVYQPPGSGNALGIVKFMFPNKHDVYLHDTPSKGLFNSQVRAFSHGCVRVRNPLKLAEMLLGEDQGWTESRVSKTVRRGQQDNQVPFQSHVPIHLTYFTVGVDDDGKVNTYSDIYGHEERIALGIAGKAHLIKQEPSKTAPSVQARGASRSRNASNGSRAVTSSGNGSRQGGRSRSGGSNSRSADTEWMRRVFQY